MNINMAIAQVVERIAYGETTRVKLQYKDDVIDEFTKKYPDKTLEVVNEDERYIYLQSIKGKEQNNE